jgi:hypothetical protein
LHVCVMLEFNEEDRQLQALLLGLFSRFFRMEPWESLP